MNQENEVFDMDQRKLVDAKMHNIISKCFINNSRPDISEVFVIYDDGNRERIWTFNPMYYDFSHREFIGKTKIEAVFHCDRKKPKFRRLL